MNETLNVIISVLQRVDIQKIILTSRLVSTSKLFEFWVALIAEKLPINGDEKDLIKRCLFRWLAFKALFGCVHGSPTCLHTYGTEKITK